MTDKLIERIKSDRDAGCALHPLEARILADATIIKAAGVMADMYDSLLGNVERLQEFNLDGDFMVLAAYRAAVSETD